MQTQTAETPRKDAWTILADAEKDAAKVEYLPEDRDPRYFFYAGDEPGLLGAGGLKTQSKCVPGGILGRCAVTPCISVQVPSRLQEIPEGRLIRGTENYRPGLGKYWLYSGPEAFTLLLDYGNKAEWESNRGLIEFDFLRGWEPSRVQALYIQDIYFPNYPSDVPDTNAAVARHVKNVQEQIMANEHPMFKWSSADGDSIVKRDIYLKAGSYMLEAVAAADRWQADKVNQSNLAITLPSTEPGYKRDFDNADVLWSRRTGVKLAVNSLRQTSMLQGVVAEHSAKNGIDPEAIAAIVAATVKAMKTDDTPAVAPAEPPAEKPAQAKPRGKKAA